MNKTELGRHYDRIEPEDSPLVVGNDFTRKHDRLAREKQEKEDSRQADLSFRYLEEKNKAEFWRWMSLGIFGAAATVIAVLSASYLPDSLLRWTR